jgi:hypothetical protein
VREELALAPRGKFSARKVLSAIGGHRRQPEATGEIAALLENGKLGRRKIPSHWTLGFQTKIKTCPGRPALFIPFTTSPATTMRAFQIGAILR